MDSISSPQLKVWRSSEGLFTRFRGPFRNGGRTLSVEHFSSGTPTPKGATIRPSRTHALEIVITSEHKTAQKDFSGCNRLSRSATSLLSDWLARSDQNRGSVDKSYYELKLRIREAALFIIAAAVVGARLCRPALAGPGSCCCPPATTQPLQARDRSAEVTRTDETEAKDIASSEPVGGLSGEGLDDKELVANEYLKTHPNDMRALKILLHARMTNGDVPRAIKVLDRMIMVEPYEIEWKMLKAQAHYYLGELEEARQTYQRILKFSPLTAGALQGLTMVMQKCGEEDAIVVMLEEALQKALSENKTKEAQNVKLLLGEMYVLQKNYEAALKNYQDLAERDPEDFRPYLWQGIIYNILEKKDEAEQQFEKYRAVVSKRFPNQGLVDNLIPDTNTQPDKQGEQDLNKVEALAEGAELPNPSDQSCAGGESVDAPNDSDN